MNEPVAWLRYVTGHERPTRIVVCSSDHPDAFPVYRGTEAQVHTKVVYLYRHEDDSTQVRAPHINDHALVRDILCEGLRAMDEGSPVYRA